jgi:hypothetical protein
MILTKSRCLTNTLINPTKRYFAVEMTTHAKDDKGKLPNKDLPFGFEQP